MRCRPLCLCTLLAIQIHIGFWVLTYMRRYIHVNPFFVAQRATLEQVDLLIRLLPECLDANIVEREHRRHQDEEKVQQFLTLMTGSSLCSKPSDTQASAGHTVSTTTAPANPAAASTEAAATAAPQVCVAGGCPIGVDNVCNVSMCALLIQSTVEDVALRQFDNASHITAHELDYGMWLIRPARLFFAFLTVGEMAQYDR